jgi:hypothetical protein
VLWSLEYDLPRAGAVKPRLLCHQSFISSIAQKESPRRSSSSEDNKAGLLLPLLLRVPKRGCPRPAQRF